MVCVMCHNARIWHHRSNDLKCPNGCDARFSMPWFSGFGPDRVPVPRHRSYLYGTGERWPASDKPDIHVNNVKEMRSKCK